MEITIFACTKLILASLLFSISIKTVINNLKLWLEYGLHFRHMVYFYIKYDIGRIFHVLEAVN